MTIDAAQIYLGGRWGTPLAGQRTDVISPHTGQPFASAVLAGVADADSAVHAARVAFDSGPWPRLAVEERIALVQRLRDLYSERVDEMARLITSENGSPLSFAQLGQAGAVPFQMDGFLDAARSFDWSEDRAGLMGVSRVIHQPVGVVAAITAWNVPQLLICGKLIPALLAGCTIVVKASPESPLDAALLADMIDTVGFPEGVVSIFAGGPDVGRHLVSHPLVDKVTFTGSAAVGREIGRTCGEQLKRCTLELGGKSAAIVLEDAALDRTVNGLKFASFMNNGQACAAQTRVLVPRSRYSDFVDAFAEAVSQFQVGDPMDLATDVGPLVTQRQQERVLGYVQIGLDEGARRVAGDGPLPADAANGWYVKPTLFADVSNEMRIAREEIFGPVIVVIPYGDEAEAIAAANDSDYGLGGSVWTGDRAHGAEVATQIRTGMVGINRFGPDPTMPFGGFKQSGIGREYGLDGLLAFTEVQVLHGI